MLGNDSDDGSGPLHAVLVSGPAHGSLELHDDGSFTYTPSTGFNREDAFTYKVTDGDYDSDVVTVTITIDTPYPWHNGLMPFDVSDDSFVSATRCPADHQRAQLARQRTTACRPRTAADAAVSGREPRQLPVAHRRVVGDQLSSTVAECRTVRGNRATGPTVPVAVLAPRN